MKKIIVNKGTSQYMEVENENVKSIILALTTDNTFALTDFSDVDIKLTQSFKGQDELIFQGDLKKLIFSLYADRQISRIEPFKTNKVVELDFGTFFTLKDGVTLKVEVDNNMYSATAQTSVLNVFTQEGQGVQTFIPKIELMSLDSTLTDFQLKLGNAVTSLVYVPNSGGDTINSAFLKSDKLDFEFNTNTIKVSADDLNYSYDGTVPYNIYKGMVQHDVNLNLRMSANASGREIYISRAIVTEYLLAQLSNKTRIHQAKNRQSILKR